MSAGQSASSCSLEVWLLHLQGGLNVVKAIKDTVALPSQNQGALSFIDASELGGQLTSLFPFLLTPFLGDSGPYTSSEHAHAPPPIFCRPLLILPVGLV